MILGTAKIIYASKAIKDINGYTSCTYIIIITASWEFPLMSTAPILNVFHILQLWTSRGFFIVVSQADDLVPSLLMY